MQQNAEFFPTHTVRRVEVLFLEVGWAEYSKMLIRQEHGRVDELLTMAAFFRQGDHKLVLEIPILKYELIPVCRIFERLSHLGNDAGNPVRIDASANPPLDDWYRAT
ncbi:hypothetical protein D3C76_1403290 [compost metagenome]